MRKTKPQAEDIPFFENIIEILFESYMIKLIGNFNTIPRNNYTVIAAKKKVVQGVVKG